MAGPVPICADTKIGPMLDAYPALEEVLISLAPPFANLRNPMLRRTVAKVATLAQAARVGGLPVNELVRKLRESAGQTLCDSAGAGADADNASEPAWVSRSSVAYDLDGDEMLEAGVHPIGKVRNCAQSLGSGEVIRLTTSFRPEPLIEVMREAGMKVYSAETAPARHTTWFAKP
jgi:hypothetical protein